MSAFEELGICPEIIAGITEQGWLLPTPVQQESIPYVLNGADICAAAETGSGKTGAFTLPILQIVHETLRNVAGSNIPVLHVHNNTETAITLDAEDKDPFVLVTSDKMHAKSDDKSNWNGIRGSCGVLTGGKYQYEVDVNSPCLCRVGWSTKVANRNLGTDSNGWGYGATGKKSWNNKFEDYGQAFQQNDTIGCLLDRQANEISFLKNGVPLGVAFQIVPTTGPMSPHICGKAFEITFRTMDFKYPAAGFAPLQNLIPEHNAANISTSLEAAGRGARQPLCLILEPTRDLALQTFECVSQYGKFLSNPSLRSVLCVGGMNEKGQKAQLQQGVDIVVGTLQRIFAWVQSGDLILSSLKFMVLDEADDLIKNDERNIITRLKKDSNSKVQTLFFSATLHGEEVKSAIEKLTNSAVWVDLKGKPAIPSTVHAVVMNIEPTHDFSFLDSLYPNPPTDGIGEIEKSTPQDLASQRMKLVKPKMAVYIADRLKMENCMIFCRTNVDCDNLEKYLVALGGNQQFRGKTEGGKENPYSCVVLAGMRDQKSRNEALVHFKEGDVRFLICTDVAARGIDISELPFLIMMTLPDEPDQFVHRVGRVGRADRMGLAVSLASTVEERVWYHRCNNRGQGCRNTKLVDKGGCNIWFTEPKYLSAIEDGLLGIQLPRMDCKTLNVPGILDMDGGSTKLEGDMIPERERNIVKAQQSAREDGEMEGDDDNGVAAETHAGTVIYGKAVNDAVHESSKKAVAELKPAAIQLMNLEQEIQRDFVSIWCRNLK